MPALAGKNDDLFFVEALVLRYHLQSALMYLLLRIAPEGIFRIKLYCKLRGSFLVRCKHQLNRCYRRAEPPCGVETGRYGKRYRRCGHLLISDSGNIQKCLYTYPFRILKQCQTFIDYDPVLIRERNDIGYRADSGKIDISVKILARIKSQPHRQRKHKLKRHSDARESVKIVFIIGAFGVYDRYRLGYAFLAGMVVGYYDVDILKLCKLRFTYGCYAAVNGYDKLRSLPYQLVERHDIYAVSLILAVRYIIFSIRTL